MMKKNITLKLSIFFIILILNCCLAIYPSLKIYQEQELSRDQVGIIDWLPELWWVSSVDGMTFDELKLKYKKTRRIELYKFDDPYDLYSYALLPGEHIITVDPLYFNRKNRLYRFEGHALLKFNVQPGHSYTIKFGKPENNRQGAERFISWLSLDRKIYQLLPKPEAEWRSDVNNFKGSVHVIDKASKEIVSESLEPHLVVTYKNGKREKLMKVQNTFFDTIIKACSSGPNYPYNIYTIIFGDESVTECKKGSGLNEKLIEIRVFYSSEADVKPFFKNLIRRRDMEKFIWYELMYGHCKGSALVKGKNFESGELKTFYLKDISRIDYFH